MTPETTPTPEVGDPFDLSQDADYRRWRDWKLANCPGSADALTIEISNLADPSPAERKAVVSACRRANMAIYACRRAPEGEALIAALARFADCFGLHRIDAHLLSGDGGFTALQVADGGRHAGYIPYTDRALNWHTDGYYNIPRERIRGMLLYCAADAAEGGENALLDHDIAYIRLRDENPDWIAALMRPDAMIIPANTEGGSEIRPARSGPVFSIDPLTATLHMRYTARTRSIVWRDDAAIRAATEFLGRLLTGTDRAILRHRFAPGQGLLSNNVLHNRTGFRDDSGRGKNRLVWRARYFDRIEHTAFTQPDVM